MALIGFYTVFAFMRTPRHVDTGAGFSFRVEFKDPCLLSVLTIDPTIVDPSPVEYILENPQLSRVFNDAKVSESETLANCPTNYEFKVTTALGNPLAAGRFAAIIRSSG